MDKTKRDEALGKLAKSPFGVVLVSWLEDKIRLMKDVTKIKTFEEMVGRQEAVKILEDLFRFLKNKRQKKEPVTKTEYT